MDSLDLWKVFELRSRVWSQNWVDLRRHLPIDHTQQIIYSLSPHLSFTLNLRLISSTNHSRLSLLEPLHSTLITGSLGHSTWLYSHFTSLLLSLYHLCHLMCIHTEWCPEMFTFSLSLVAFFYRLLMCHEAGQSAFLHINTVVFMYESWSYLIYQRFLTIAFLCWCAVKQSINQSCHLLYGLLLFNTVWE